MNEFDGQEVIKRFTAQRDEAFLSLDEQKIRNFCIKWNGHDMPTNMEVFWRAVHKAITGNMNLPIEFRKKSKKYLIDRGLMSFDDGDL